MAEISTWRPGQISTKLTTERRVKEFRCIFNGIVWWNSQWIFFACFHHIFCCVIRQIVSQISSKLFVDWFLIHPFNLPLDLHQKFSSTLQIVCRMFSSSFCWIVHGVFRLLNFHLYFPHNIYWIEHLFWTIIHSFISQADETNENEREASQSNSKLN